MKKILAILFLPLQLFSADYFVLTNGNNASDGLSWSTAWQTLSNAAVTAPNGSRIYVGGGDFDEYVYIQTRALQTWISESNAITRAFRIGTASNTISGFRTTEAQDVGQSWLSFFRIEAGAHYTTISNCFIGDTPVATATNFTFSDSPDSITWTGGDFIGAGFKNGGKISWGGCSLTNFWFANMLRNGTITNITTEVLSFADGTMVAETNSSAWSLIQPGTSPQSPMVGVNFIPGGGTSATNCTIIGSTFSNIYGQAIFLRGYNNKVLSNTLTRIIGNNGICIAGSNHEIIGNYAYDCPLPIWYSAYELINEVPHEGEGTYYDYLTAFLHPKSYTTTWNTNNLIAWNWFDRIEQPIASIGPVGAGNGVFYRDWRVVSNVFSRIHSRIESAVNNYVVSNNTFYRCAINESERFPATFGGRVDEYATNVAIMGNIFANCGDHSNPGSEGYYTLVFAEGTIVTNYNMVTSSRVMGWTNTVTWSELNGINGGDPMFANEEDPLGPDGLPFTDDDGLRILSGSIAEGKGALPIKYSLSPYFVPATNSLRYAWFEATGSNYNTAWQELLPFQRTGPFRSLTAPDPPPKMYGYIPLTATNSIGGTWSTNDWIGIRDFAWTFDNGDRWLWARWPDIMRTWLRTGEVTITLTVTNSVGDTGSISKLYNVEPPAGWTADVWHVATNGVDSNPGTQASPFLTITNAFKNAGPGDYISVSPGTYTNEYVDVKNPFGVDGTLADPITFVAYAYLPTFTNRASHWIFEGPEITGVTNDAVTPAIVYVPSAAKTNLTFRNFYIHHTPWSMDLFSVPRQSSTTGHRDYLFQNNVLHQVAGSGGGFVISGITNVTLDANIQTYSMKQSDIRVDGYTVSIKRNFYYAHGYTNGNHSDFIVWINPDVGAPEIGNYTIEQNWLEGESWALQGTNAPTQIVNAGPLAYLPGTSNFVFRNNVFINIWNGMNPVQADGVKLYNNLFYDCVPHNGQLIVLGTTVSTGYGQRIFNNAFVYNGSTTNTGWYETATLTDNTNLTLTANFNFVTHSNNVPKQNWDAGRPTNQWWGLWGLPAFAAGSIGTGVPEFDQAATEASGINGGDPLFSDPTTRDFRLQDASPLVASGTDLSAEFTTDFFGRTRSAWNIGPFELTAETGQLQPSRKGSPIGFRIPGVGIR